MVLWLEWLPRASLGPMRPYLAPLVDTFLRGLADAHLPVRLATLRARGAEGLRGGPRPVLHHTGHPPNR